MSTELRNKHEKPVQEKKVVSNKKPKKKEPVKEVVVEATDVSDVDDLFASTPSAPPVSTIKSVNSFKYNWYLSNLRSKIENNWTPSIKDSTLAVELSFTILKNGSLSGLSVTKRSGKAILDTQAKRAVELAFPMPKLPSGYSSGSLQLIYTLVPFRN